MRRTNLALIPAYLLLASGLTAQTYEDWRSLEFSELQLSDANISGNIADPDGDGIPNLLEFVFSADPWENNQPQISTALVGNYLTITYRERDNLAPAEVWLQGSDNLRQWATYNTRLELSRTAATGYDWVTLQDPIEFPIHPSRRFIRLRVFPEAPPFLAPAQVEVGFHSPTEAYVAWTDPNTNEIGYSVTHISYMAPAVATTGADAVIAGGLSVSFEDGFTYYVTAHGPNNELLNSSWASALDSDFDGIPDYFERKGQGIIPGTFQTDPNSIDTDGDGISDNYELFIFLTDPTAEDSDGDGMPDGWEIYESGTDPLVNDATGDTDEDGLSNVEEYNHGTYPYIQDSDGDGLSDGAEVNTHGSDPTLKDTDSDEMPDGWEVEYGLDPASDADAFLDLDSDSLMNVWEYRLGLLPQNTDSDGNGTADGDEDRDYDGLTNAQEIGVHGTDPAQPDTDLDGLNDGWEIKYGLLALIDNLTDGTANNNPDADPDTDGLKNSEEEQIDSNPFSSDTDGDGFSDLDEYNAGSNAGSGSSTPDSNGTGSNKPPVITVSVTFGDHSGSHSEKYRVILEPMANDANAQQRYRTNAKYGEPQTATFKLPAGARYRVKIAHVGTDPQYTDTPKPDYDYTLGFSVDSAPANVAIVTEDPDGILGVHDESETFYASGKSAFLNIAWLSSIAPLTSSNNLGRTKLGVGETAFLTLKPFSMPAPTWSLGGTYGTSTLSTDEHSATLTASKRASTPQVTATVLGANLNLNYTVIQPSGEVASKTEDLVYSAGSQGAGMKLMITTLPTDVSFANVEVLEVDKGTSNVYGIFSNYTAEDLKHSPTANWTTLNSENQWTDEASFWGHGTPSTWTHSGFQWAIEVRWRVVGETGNGEFLANRTQIFTIIDSTGKSTVTKMGQTVTRTP